MQIISENCVSKKWSAYKITATINRIFSEFERRSGKCEQDEQEKEKNENVCNVPRSNEQQSSFASEMEYNAWMESVIQIKSNWIYLYHDISLPATSSGNKFILHYFRIWYCTIFLMQYRHFVSSFWFQDEPKHSTLNDMPFNSTSCLLFTICCVFHIFNCIGQKQYVYLLTCT